MNPIVDYDGNKFEEKVLVDFQYFIQSAVEKKIQWNVLTYFLTDLAPTIDKSRQVIMILVKELEKWVRKWENASKDEENSLASLEISGSDYGNNEDVIEANIDGQSDYKDDFEEDNEDLQLDENDDVVLDNFGNQFYEFIGDNLKETQNDEELETNTELNESTNTIERDLLNESSKTTSKKPFQCKHCEKCFNRSSILKVHERIHTGERPYKCKTCEKRFKALGNLQRHKIIHKNEKSFQCNKCESCFNRSDALKRHIKRYHP